MIGLGSDKKTYLEPIMEGRVLLRQGRPDACSSTHLDLVASVLGAAKGNSVLLASPCALLEVVAGTSALDQEDYNQR